MTQNTLLPETEENKGWLAEGIKPEERVTIKVDDKHELTFRLIKWSPSKVLKRLPEYGSLLAVPLSMYPKEEDIGFNDYEQKIAMSLLQFFVGLEEKQLDSLVKEILDEVYTDKGQSISMFMDELFIKCPEILTDLCAKVLEINYAPFMRRGFSGALTQLRGLVPLSQK